MSIPPIAPPIKPGFRQAYGAVSAAASVNAGSNIRHTGLRGVGFILGEAASAIIPTTASPAVHVASGVSGGWGWAIEGEVPGLTSLAATCTGAFTSSAVAVGFGECGSVDSYDVNTSATLATGLVASLTPTEDGSAYVLIEANGATSGIVPTVNSYSPVADAVYVRNDTALSDVRYVVAVWHNRPAGVAFQPDIVVANWGGSPAGVRASMVVNPAQPTQATVIESGGGISTATGNWPMPTAAQAEFIEPGDTFIMFNATNLGRVTNILNAAELDDIDQIASSHTMGYLFMPNGYSDFPSDWLGAVDPPTHDITPAGTTNLGWAIVRGLRPDVTPPDLQVTANVTFSSAIVTVTTANNNDCILALVGGGSNESYAGDKAGVMYSSTTAHAIIATFPTAGSNAVTVALGGTTTAYRGGWAVVSAKPNQRLVSDVQVDGLVSAVLEAGSTGQFIESSIVADAQVSVTLTQTRSRFTPRPLVWVYGLDYVRRNALD